MMLPLGDVTVIEKSVQGMYDVVGRVIVVVGWQAERIRSLLTGYDKVECVPNADYRSGMFSSVKTGIAHVRAPRFFLLPGDHPLIGSDVYTRMLTVTGDIVIPTFEGHKGHPVLISSRLTPEIQGYPDSASLRDYIRAKGHAEVQVEHDGVLIDIDRPEDYELVLARYRLKGEGAVRIHLDERLWPSTGRAEE